METIKTFRRIRKNALRDKWEFLLMLKKLFAENPTNDPEAIANRAEGLKEKIAEIRSLAKKNNDPLAKSLREAPHGVADEWGSYTTFGFLDSEFETATDDEIREYLDDTMRVELRCTDGNPDGAGNAFTSRLNFYRTPVGVAYIHEVSLNI